MKMTSTEDKENNEVKDSTEEASLNFADLKKKFLVVKEEEEENKENLLSRKRSRTKSNSSGKKQETYFEFNADAEWCVIAAKCDYQKMARRLVDNPLLARAKDPMSGYTALHWACKVGSLDAVKMLAGTYKASIDAKTHGGYTPSHLAAMFDNRDVYNILDTQYGADFNIRDNNGRRSFSYLKQTEIPPIIQVDSVVKREVTQILPVIERTQSGRFVLDEDEEEEDTGWVPYFKKSFTSLRRSFRHKKTSVPDIKEEKIEPVKVTVDLFEAKAKEEAPTSPMSLDVPDGNFEVQPEDPDNTNVSAPGKRKTLLATGQNTTEELPSLRIEKDHQWNEIDLNSDSETLTIPVPQLGNVTSAPTLEKQQQATVPTITVTNESKPATHSVADPFLQGRVEYTPEDTAGAVPDRVDYVPGYDPELNTSFKDQPQVVLRERPHSDEDLEKMCSRMLNKNFSVYGEDIGEKRRSVLQKSKRSLNLDKAKKIQVLERTLKGKEKEVEAIDTLFDEPLTPEKIDQFRKHYPELCKKEAQRSRKKGRGDRT